MHHAGILGPKRKWRQISIFCGWRLQLGCTDAVRRRTAPILDLRRTNVSGSTSPTRTELVYRRVRSEILAGKLQPGSRLPLVELAKRFSVSQTVVREALTKLAGQEMVRSSPQQGFRVASLTLEDLTDLTEARTHLECLVLRLSIERGDLTWETKVVAAHHQLLRTEARTGGGQTRNEWLDAHEDFHASLLDGCGNNRLLHAARRLRNSAALYRVWSRPLGHDEHRDLNAEHRSLLDAVVARDSKGAAELLAHHIERARALLLTIAEPKKEAWPRPF